MIFLGVNAHNNSFSIFAASSGLNFCILFNKSGKALLFRIKPIIIFFVHMIFFPFEYYLLLFEDQYSFIYWFISYFVLTAILFI